MASLDGDDMVDALDGKDESDRQHKTSVHETAGTLRCLLSAPYRTAMIDDEKRLDKSQECDKTIHDTLHILHIQAGYTER